MNIPIDIRVELTTRSMIKNGTKMMKPMMNAVFSSESTKAGISVVERDVARASAASCSPTH